MVKYPLDPEPRASPSTILGTQWDILSNITPGASGIPTDLREAAAGMSPVGRRLRRRLLLPASAGYPEVL
jgi:NitT/TauT family transport system permease protein